MISPGFSIWLKTKSKSHFSCAKVLEAKLRCKKHILRCMQFIQVLHVFVALTKATLLVFISTHLDLLSSICFC
jgi:hypothetical protein